MSLAHKLRPLVKRTILRSGALRLASRKGARKVAILRYHSILHTPEDFGESIGSGIIHSSQDFSAQMELLASKYNPVSLDEVCAFVAGGGRFAALSRGHYV